MFPFNATLMKCPTVYSYTDIRKLIGLITIHHCSTYGTLFHMNERNPFLWLLRGFHLQPQIQMSWFLYDLRVEPTSFLITVLVIWCATRKHHRRDDSRSVTQYIQTPHWNKKTVLPCCPTGKVRNYTQVFHSKCQITAEPRTNRKTFNAAFCPPTDWGTPLSAHQPTSPNLNHPTTFPTGVLLPRNQIN